MKAINNNWMIHRKERTLEKKLIQTLQSLENIQTQTQTIQPNIINLNSYLTKCNKYTYKTFNYITI